MAKYTQVSRGSADTNTVKTLQEMLNKNGANLTVDGKFGPATEAAVKAYQTKNNLTVDGIVGNNTWAALTSAATKPTTTNTTATATAPAKTQAPTFEYTKSDAVAQAEALLQQQLANKPGEFQFSQQAGWDEIINKILNREDFSYDLNGDALYQQYKDQYMLQGQQAMMDTMGQAAAMTGGYGNSYAQTVGQQTYQGYLQQLNDRVPELYQLALDKYNQEGQDLYNQYGLYSDQYGQEYDKYRDTVSNYYTDLNYLTENARYMSETEYQRAMDDFNIKYGAYRDDVSDQQWQTQFDEAQRQYNESVQASGGSSTNPGDTTGDKTGDTYTAKPSGWDEAKIRAFQEAHRLTVDGIWGPKTAAAYDKDSDWTGGSTQPQATSKTDAFVAQMNEDTKYWDAIARHQYGSEKTYIAQQIEKNTTLSDNEKAYLITYYGITELDLNYKNGHS